MIETFHRKKSIRLRGYDYGKPGFYYVTICTYRRNRIFGIIDDLKMKLSPIGKVVQSQILEIPEKIPGVRVDCFVIMPNHIHAIIAILERNERNSLPKVVSFLKSKSQWLIKKTSPDVGKVWQANYFDHVIRTDAVLERKRKYISGNIMMEALEEFDPDLDDRKAFENVIVDNGRYREV